MVDREALDFVLGLIWDEVAIRRRHSVSASASKLTNQPPPSPLRATM